MSSVGCDRRILKAFYTQYVAVLLIVLTFCIGAYQRASVRGNFPKAAAVMVAPPDVQLTELKIERLFAENGDLRDAEARLEAVASLLKSHDVNATVILSAERSELGENSRDLARKLHEIEQFLIARSVPREAFVLRVRAESGRDGQLSVSFARLGEVPNEGR